LALILDDAQFFERYARLLKTAFQSGMETVELPSEPKMLSFSRWRDFRRACHRGYDRAQQEIIELLVSESGDIRAQANREILLRKVADALAFTISGSSMHILKRLCLHDQAPFIQIDQLQRYAIQARELNSQSRDTFALICDLTTCVHVGDLMRVDMREGKAFFEILELKQGGMNAEIGRILEQYPLNSESLQGLQSDPRLKTNHQKKQATRMFNQNLRHSRARESINNDVGIDIKTGLEVRHSKKTYYPVHFSESLSEACAEAKKCGVAAATINFCLHLGVSFNQSSILDEQLAKAAAEHALKVTRSANSNLADVETDTRQCIPNGKLIQEFDLLDFNLRSTCVYPFVIWDISREDRLLIAQRKLVVKVLLDVPAFLWFAKDLGIDLRWSTRKETAIHRASRSGMLAWDNKMLKFANGMTIGPGSWSRMLAELVTPYSLLTQLDDLANEPIED
jgi:hypothetical protein